MRTIGRIAFAVGCAGWIIWGFIGCDRLKGTLNANQRPTVEFVNVPMDSTSFNYAPVIYWYGHDPDGLVEYYSWYDDTTHAAIHAYTVDSLREYVQNIPPDGWTDTTATKATIYLLTPAGDTTQHIFFLRCTDNEGAASEVKARAYFRSNQPPNQPCISAAGSDSCFHHGIVLDTLLMGDTLTQIYGGLPFNWTGNDPDDRALVTIPLEFSYLIVRWPSDTIYFPGDTIQANGWSKWSATKMKTLYGLETGWYSFFVKSRDDGLTECAEPASYIFYCIHPTFQYKLLVVDENRPFTGMSSRDFGCVSPDSIMDFHRANLDQAWPIMNMIYPDCTFTMDDIKMWTNRGDYQNRLPIPYSLIHQFQLVWLINDNPANISDSWVQSRIHVMEAYLQVGGMIMITGRKIFCGCYGICTEGTETFSGSNAKDFFHDYFNVSEGIGPAWPCDADFGGTMGAMTEYPDLQVDTARLHTANYGTATHPRYVDCLPEVDWIGRNQETSTIYYYYSCSAATEDSVYNVDFTINESLSTPDRCRLQSPSVNGKILYERLVSVSRIYNRTKNVYGEFMYFADNNTTFWVSTPIWAGKWVDADTLEVDFTYIPTKESHLKPAATVFQNMQEIINYTNHTWSGRVLFRTSLVSFPLYFIKNDVLTQNGLPPVVEFLAVQFMFFYSQREYAYHWGG